MITQTADPPGPAGRLRRIYQDLKEGLKVWKYGAKEWSAYTVGNNISDAKWLALMWPLHGQEWTAFALQMLGKTVLFTKVFVTTAVAGFVSSN